MQLTCNQLTVAQVSGIRITKVLVIGVLFIACSGNSGEQQNAGIIVEKVYSKPPASVTGTLTVTGNTAVFFNPDPDQLGRIRAANDSMIFESMTHDCYYQMNNARLLMQKAWPQVSIQETNAARYLLFITNNGDSISIDLDTKNDMCGIILFNGVKQPLMIDMMNIDTELNTYFTME